MYMMNTSKRNMTLINNFLIKISHKYNGDYYDAIGDHCSRIEIPYKGLSICYDTFLVSNYANNNFTRLRVCFKNRSDYNLNIKRKSIINLFQNNIALDDEDFTKAYKITTSNENTTVKILSNKTLRTQLSSIKDVNLIIGNSDQYSDIYCSKDESMLSITLPRFENSEDKIENLIIVFKTLIDNLLDFNIITDEKITTALYN